MFHSDSTEDGGQLSVEASHEFRGRTSHCYEPLEGQEIDEVGIGKSGNGEASVRQCLKQQLREVVVAQLVERSLPIPEVRGSNPVIGKIYIEHLFTCLLSTVLKRRK